MGFRSVGITEHTGVTIPQWFKDKWDDELNIPVYSPNVGYREELVGTPRTPISYKFERKWHDDIIEDLQKVVAEDVEWSGNKLDMVIMHEDSRINKVEIYRDKVVYLEPSEWEEVEEMRLF